MEQTLIEIAKHLGEIKDILSGIGLALLCVWITMVVRLYLKR